MKITVRNIPIIGPVLAHLRSELRDSESSSDYWERRYKTGGDSGAGSYGRLAEFKANFLNKFVAEHDIASVIEYGCGDGAQLKLARYARYIGVDVSSQAVQLCRTLFADDTSKRFVHWNATAPELMADLSLSLDVVYHLVEDSIFDAYMRRLFESACRYVIVYSSNWDQDCASRHVRHRRFTSWVEQNKPDWCLQSTVKNAYPVNSADHGQTSCADFYVFEPYHIPADK